MVLISMEALRHVSEEDAEGNVLAYDFHRADGYAMH